MKIVPNKVEPFLGNGLAPVKNIEVIVDDYVIIPKRDFGNAPPYINGKYIYAGYIVTKNGVNVMPGAAWFPTIPEAIVAIRVLEDHPEDFFNVYNALYECEY